MKFKYSYLLTIIVWYTCYTFKFPLTIFPDYIGFDIIHNGKPYLNKEICIDISFGSQLTPFKILINTFESSSLWIEHNNPLMNPSEYIPYYFNPNTSDSYNYLRVDASRSVNDYLISGQLSKETIQLSSDLLISNITFFLKKVNDTYYYNKNIGGFLLLAFNELPLSLIKENLDFISQLKQRHLVTKHLFSIDTNYLYLDEIPFNKEEYSTCSVTTPITCTYWMCTLEETNFNHINSYRRSIFVIEFLYIQSTSEYFNMITNEYLKDLIQVKKQCQVVSNFDYELIECDKRININKLSDLNFGFEGGLKITMKAKELFYERNDKEKLVFMIIHKKIRNFYYDWIFGNVVFKHYSVFFDHDNKMIGFKRIQNNVENFHNDNVVLMKNILKWNAIIIAISLIFLGMKKFGK
jgi:hypothetical protein